jgi:uncharacterized protein (DUF58 family)
MTTMSGHHYLDPQTLASIGSIDLRARMIVEGLMTGQHRSPYQGFSIEFAQHRQYAPGDDTRFLDWKVYGKTDKLYLKQYQKETNLDMLVLVDVSGSMAYGSSLSPEKPRDGDPSALRGVWRKFDHAASLAAGMAFLALKQQDRVGLMLFSDRVKTQTRMSNGRDHWRTIAETLGAAELDQQPQRSHGLLPDADNVPGRTDLKRVFDQVLAKLTQRSLVVVISDLFDHDESGLERSLARLHHRRHDVIVLQTLDHAELEFPFRKAAEFIGLEAEGRLPVDPLALREGYLEALRRHLETIEEVTRRFHFDYLTLDTSQPLGAPLSHFLARRAAAVGKRS